MSKKVSLSKEYLKGLWENNPVLRQVLGMCPVLAVTTSVLNGIAMALAATFVLFFSSTIIAIIRKFIPNQVRIASYIVVIATFVTIVDLVMKAQFPELSKSLGPYIPLIVVNCIILGRAEAFASKNNVGRAMLDALGMGSGFLIALVILSSVRELFGSGTILGFQIMPDFYEPWLVMILPAGAFLTLGSIMGFFTFFSLRRKKIIFEADIKNDIGRKKPIITSSAEV